MATTKDLGRHGGEAGLGDLGSISRDRSIRFPFSRKDFPLNSRNCET